MSRPTFHHYQTDAIRFALARSGALFAMPMGSGKTAVALEIANRTTAKRVLVLTPKSVIANWERQAKFWLPDSKFSIVCFDDGAKVERKKERLKNALGQASFRACICVVNYEIASQIINDKMLPPWDLIILDECHKTKNSTAKISQFMRKWAEYMRKCNKTFKIIGLTATPSPNGYIDLYMQGAILVPGLLAPTKKMFESRYCIMGGFQNREVIGYQNVDELKTKLDKFMFVVDPKYVPIPVSLAEETIFVRCLPKLAKMHKSMLNEMFAIIESSNGVITAQNALSRIMRLRQICSGILSSDEGEHFEETAKTEVIADLIENMGPKEPIVIFCEFRYEIAVLRKLLKDRFKEDISELSGARNELREWEEGITRVLVAQSQAGSTGIDTMKRANVAIWMSVGYNLATFQQAKGRLHRQGQQRDVRHFFIVTEDTIEEKIMAALDKKSTTMSDLLSSMLNRSVTVSGEKA